MSRTEMALSTKEGGRQRIIGILPIRCTCLMDLEVITLAIWLKNTVLVLRREIQVID